MVTTDFLRSLLGDTPEAIGGFEYERFPSVFDKCADQRRTKKRLVELVFHKGLPIAGTIQEGASRSYNKMQQIWKTNAYMQYYQSNYVLTWQLLQHLPAKSIVATVIKGTTERAGALKMKKDKAFADMLNNYDTSSQTFGDGLTLGNSAHLTGDGSTYSNIAAAAADINEQSVEAAVKVIRGFTDPASKPIMPGVKKILSGTNLEFDGQRLLQTEYTLGTNYNDKNIIATQKYIPEGHLISPFILNDGSWHIITDVPDGLVTFTACDPMFDMRPLANTFDTEMTAIDAYVHTSGDARGIYVYPRS